VIHSPFAEGQKAFIFAGYGREQTRAALGTAIPDILRGMSFKDGDKEVQSMSVSLLPVSPGQPFTEVDAYQADALIRGIGDIVVIDVRASPYYITSHIPEAINVPSRKMGVRLSELPKDSTYLPYCGGNSESIYAGQLLAAAGYDSVYRLVDGYVAWRKAGYPAERGGK